MKRHWIGCIREHYKVFVLALLYQQRENCSRSLRVNTLMLIHSSAADNLTFNMTLLWRYLSPISTRDSSRCAVRACGCRHRACPAGHRSANIIMTALRAIPAPGIHAQTFINLSRSDVRRDGDLIRLRIIFLREKSCPFVASRPPVAARTFVAEFMTDSLRPECITIACFLRRPATVAFYRGCRMSRTTRAAGLSAAGAILAGALAAISPCRLPHAYARIPILY